MTTNVYDSNVGLIASDSRWSVTWGSRIVYVDDANFNKIEIHKGVAFVFAGSGVRVQEWKDWLKTDPVDDTNMPGCDGMSVCMTRIEDKQVLFSERQDIVKDGGFFAGSGSRHAFTCWNNNRNALKSVESAKLLDPYTGGEVKYVDFTSQKNNLVMHPASPATIRTVSEALSSRGHVMNIAPDNGTAPPFKLSEIAANDAEARELQEKLLAGQISPEAPCDGMYDEWTAEQTSRLKSALGKVFNWKS